jgi:glycosyltransferase involved in cell wall biosynthesis
VRGFTLSSARMNWTTECAVVIPCLNEAWNVAQVIAAVRRVVPTVFVIDDGSQDETTAVARNAGAEVIRNAVSQGKGAALQTGWRLALERGFNWALAMDGDGQHSADDVPKFFEVAERTGAKLVIGNRMDDPKGMPLVRRWVNRWMSARISKLAGMSLPDSQCGFRLMNLEAWNRLPMEASHFEIESEVLLAFARAGGAIEFAPIEVIYKSEQSKIHPVRDTVRWVKWWRRVGRYDSLRFSVDGKRVPAHPGPLPRGEGETLASL